MSASFRAHLDDHATFDSLLANQVDVTGAQHVQISVDRPRGVIHVNVNGVCLLRVCRIEGYVEVDFKAEDSTGDRPKGETR